MPPEQQTPADGVRRETRKKNSRKAARTQRKRKLKKKESRGIPHTSGSAGGG
jgi:hypothetical protein